MTVSQILSATADAAAQRYGLLLDGWKNLYLRALDDSDFGTPKQLNRVTAQAYSMGSLFLNGEGSEMQDAFDDIAQRALTATRDELIVEDSETFPDAVDEHVSAFEAHLTTELSIQIERDIAHLKQTLQRTVLSVTLASRAQRLPVKTALLQHRIGGATEPKFGFSDRRGAKWPARRYIRTIWRHDLLALYNDVVLMTLADHGIDTAQIRHTDTTSAWHGMEVAMIANTELPTYADVRDEAFHPNSDAVIARVA